MNVLLHRKVLLAYEDSWQKRCRILFCCTRLSDRKENSFADIARLLSDFFRDLDVVPSDVIAGLVLLRHYQKIERKAIVEQVRSHYALALNLIFHSSSEKTEPTSSFPEFPSRRRPTSCRSRRTQIWNFSKRSYISRTTPSGLMVGPYN